MGSFASVFGVPEQKILVSGLTGAGKTSFMYRLYRGDNGILEYIDQDGIEIEEKRHRDLHFISWNCDQVSINKSKWNKYYPNTSALIWIVDSRSTPNVTRKSGDILRDILSDEEMKNVLVLILATKHGMYHKLLMDIWQIIKHLELGEIKQEWVLQLSSNVTGDGLYDGMHWIEYKLNKSANRRLATPDYYGKINMNYVDWITSKVYDNPLRREILIDGYIRLIKVYWNIPQSLHQMIYEYYGDDQKRIIERHNDVCMLSGGYSFQ